MQKKIIKLLIVSIIIFIIGVFFISLNKSSLYDTKGLEGQIITDIKLEHFNEKKIITKIEPKKAENNVINLEVKKETPKVLKESEKDEPLILTNEVKEEAPLILKN